MTYPTDGTDDQWQLMEDCFPPVDGPGRPRTVDLRRVVHAVLYQARTGCQWRFLPSDVPPSGTVRSYFDKWTIDGTLLDLHNVLRRDVRVQQGRMPDPTAMVLDSQSVKTTEAGGPRGFDGGKKVRGRKRQCAVDTQGNLLTVAVQAANVQDRDGVEAILNEMHDLCPAVTHAWADAGYRGDLVVEVATRLGITSEIVTRADDQVGFQVQPRRWVVERSIAWVNRCRRLSKDYERHTINSAAWI